MALFFVEMLVESAKQAGISVPSDLCKYDPIKYPHWNVYVKIQLGASLPYPTAYCDNARIIAKIPKRKITKVTFCDLIGKGLHIKT